jgi:topoisomerase-4 subunit A
MIRSVEEAAKKGKLKISSINDYTAEKVNIEINLARNTYAQEIVDALYAYTDCETKLSINPLVIKDNVPTIMGVHEILDWHARHLVVVLKAELELEKGHLLDKLHAPDP